MRRDATFIMLGAVLAVVVIIAGSAVLPLLRTQMTAALPKPDNTFRVMNMGGPALADEYMFADMLQSLEPGQIAVWNSPFGDARWAIRRLPDAHITVDDVVAMVGATPPHLKAAEANNDRSGIPPENVRRALQKNAEDIDRLKVIAKRYPLPDGWPQEAIVWKRIKDRAAGKSYLVPFEFLRPLPLNPDGTVAPRRGSTEPMQQIYMDTSPDARRRPH
jgi:hypothetical protein